MVARAVIGAGHAAWSPDSRSIAFSGSFDGGPDQGWIAPADGSGPPQVFTSVPGAWDPIWSPDGTHLAIGSSIGSDARLLVMNRDGSDVRQVNRGAYTEIGERGEVAEWSPDGAQLLFTAFTGDGNADFEQEVYVVGLDGRARASPVADRRSRA